MSERTLTPADLVRVAASSVTLVSMLFCVGTAGSVCTGLAAVVGMTSGDGDDETELCNEEGLTEEEKLGSARHEAGHTVVALALHPEWFEQTDLYPLGIMVGDTCATGITSITTPSDMSRDDLRDWMAILYGGYVVDLRHDGQPSSGSSRDIRVATLIAVEAVNAMGMGEVTPPYNFEVMRDGGIALGAHVEEARAMEVERMLSEAIGLAITVVSENTDEVDAIALALADSPTLTLTPDDVAAALADRSLLTEDDPLQSYE